MTGRPSRSLVVTSPVGFFLYIDFFCPRHGGRSRIEKRLNRGGLFKGGRSAFKIPFYQIIRAHAQYMEIQSASSSNF